MKIIDLSQKIYDKMPIHPYDEEVIVAKNRTIENDKYSNTQQGIGMHSGTHIDAPCHLIENGKNIAEYELSKFIGRGCVINVFGQSEITLKEEYKNKIEKSEIVLLYTSYGDFFNDEKYYHDDAPNLSNEFAEYLGKSNIKMVGMDLSSPDKYPFDIHKILLENDILIIENLTNLDKLLGIDEFTVYALPLNINAEASVARVVAIIE